MTPPPVSIGLPVYNGETYLHQAIRSVRAQTLADFELVISDNASTDGTREICESHAAADGRIRYLRYEENRGAAWNFNHVAQEARGPFFKWMGHDDVWMPELLERSVDTLQAAPPSVVLCHPGTMMIDAEGRVTEHYQDRIDLRHQSPSARLRGLYEGLYRCNAVFGLMRREALDRTRMLGGYGSADAVLLAELALQGQLWYLHEPLFQRRIHPQQSVEAHPDARAMAIWFDPANRTRGVIAPSWRVLREHLRAIERAGLPHAERWRCRRALTQGWLPRHRLELLREAQSMVGLTLGARSA